jgi:hypothetical protein
MVPVSGVAEECMVPVSGVAEECMADMHTVEVNGGIAAYQLLVHFIYLPTSVTSLTEIAAYQCCYGTLGYMHRKSANS